MNKFVEINLKKLVKENKISYANDYLNNSKLLLKNDFCFQHVYDMEPSPKIYHLEDWQVSPNGDPEWLYVLKRQEYLQDLLYSYISTNDLTYLKQIRFFILDWIKNNDDNKKVRFNSWRTIDTGIRLLNWSKPLDYLISKKIVNSNDISRINDSVARQAKYLFDNYIEKYDLSNWGVLITTGILTFDSEHPNIINSEIAKWALDKFCLELKLQVDATGVHWEQSPLYFIEVFRSSLCVIASYKTNNKHIPDEVLQTLKRMFKSFDYQIKPNGKLLQQGDTDAIRVKDLVASAEYILYGIVHSADLQDFLLMTFGDKARIIVADNKATKKLNFDSVISGNFYLKDSEKNDYWHIYNGNLGSGHGHAASGHIDLTINNDDILIDPGRFTYVNTHKRRYLKSGLSHNVVLLDGAFPTTPLNSWKFKTVVTNQRNEVYHSTSYDEVKCSYIDKSNKYIVTRYFIWLRKLEIMVVIDVAEYQGTHVQTDNWILAPGAQAKTISKNNFLIKLHQNQYSLFHSLKETKITNQIYAPRYNELEKGNKIMFSDNFTNNNVSYTVIGKQGTLKNVNYLDSLRNGKVDGDAIHSFSLLIDLSGKHSVTLNIQHQNTIKGNKIYYVDGIPFYGNVSVKYQ